MSVDVLLTIGEFSKMTYLSVKALRHYHDVGLLAPVTIDPDTGYRRYASSQVATAQAIRRFRDLDMPIDDVRDVLAASDSADRNRVILQHLERMRRQLERTQHSVESLQALLEEEPRARRCRTAPDPGDPGTHRPEVGRIRRLRRVAGAGPDRFAHRARNGRAHCRWFRWRPLSRRVLRGRGGRGHRLRARSRTRWRHRRDARDDRRRARPRRPVHRTRSNLWRPGDDRRRTRHRSTGADSRALPHRRPAPRCAGRSRSERPNDHRHPHPRIHHL